MPNAQEPRYQFGAITLGVSDGCARRRHRKVGDAAAGHRSYALKF
ncbi:MAG: hypothetical protein ACYTX0_32550 [Nostoc sp.]